ncbi:DUF2510 domain-containing protein [Nocardia sp. NPDC004711]
MSDPTPPVGDPATNRRNNRILLGVLGVLGLFVLLVVIGAIFGKDKGKDTSAAPSTTVAPSTTAPTVIATSAAPAQPSATTAAPTTPAIPQAASDPRCAPAAAGTIALVQAGLSHAGWSLTNGTVLDAGGRTFFGATIVDESGKVRERSDVWVVAGGKVYASTGGARNNSTFPKASSAPLSISPGDEAVQAVDACVIAQTLGR